MLQAFLVLPALGFTYLLLARTSFGKRILHLVGAFAAMVLAGGWWVAIVSLWPAGSRPYIGGSQNNSILELTLGYNGFGRLSGDETGSVGGMGGQGGRWGTTGIARLFNSEIGGQVAWLIPAALILGAAALWFGRADRRIRAAVTLWGATLLVTGLINIRLIRLATSPPVVDEHADPLLIAKTRARGWGVTLDALERYGHAIGLAFQIRDDLLDIEAGTEQLGKTAGKDAVAAKPTYPAILGVDASRAELATLTARALAAIAPLEAGTDALRDLALFVSARTS